MRVAVLLYHQIAEADTASRYIVSPGDFARQMRYLSERGYHVISLNRLVGAFTRGDTLPERSVVITFDDGFLDTYVNSSAVLTASSFTATFFMVTGLTGKCSAWMVGNQYRSMPLMGWPEMEHLQRAGFEIGSHTVRHPRLTQLTIDDAGAEIGDSKKALEDRLGVAVTSFAYPYGNFDSRTRDLVEAAGYDVACSTLSGFANENNDRFALRRVEIFGGDSLRNFGRKIAFGANEVKPGDILRYYALRVRARFSN